MDEQISNVTVIMSRGQVLKSLQVSDSTLRNYSKVLSVVAPSGWDYRKKDRGFTMSAFRVLVAFQGLVKQGGVRPATATIKKVMGFTNG